ncbi:DUF5988 family protein [Streptomyces syringium]|uniref:DUF5988 family protein n=1 Tax=Streptomyces syringium TaxID=76729 RepID=UPI00341C6AF7
MDLLVVTIVLTGGPNGLCRVQQLAETEVLEKFTVAFYGQHMHFERTGRFEMVDGRELPVFQWIYNTAIAE